MPSSPPLPTTLFLDRDGVINRNDHLYYVLKPEEMELLPGSAEAIAAVNQAGIRVVVITNQAHIAKGLSTEEKLHAIHQRMQKLLSEKAAHVDAIYHCPHYNSGCRCRKPLPGLILQAAADHPVELAKSWFVGDSARDMVAAHGAGCPGAIVRSGHGKKAAASYPELPIFDDLGSFVRAYLTGTLPDPADVRATMARCITLPEPAEKA
uniref:D,D-heptose 1,7-bisphosphate phosphatase n=1 Tax=Magnetococcus massalia (strain MO-1) TaxID=451514 RepID=A0A1S7LG79_MAGMO|nr:D,D-heptose 1,7-bisphosphate phosphatase [Candidatus Magnetococcus massalia]